MIPIDKFSLQEHDGEYENRPLKSLLLYCGESLGVKVSGYVIEKQFELTDYFLLLINWDCPFEEGCELVVVSKNRKVVGAYSFNPFYNSYNLSCVKEISKNRFKIIFNDSVCFEVIINYPKKYLLRKIVSVKKLENSKL